MNNMKFSGTGVALVTPFRKEGNIEYKSFEKLLSHVSNDGVDFLVAMGTTSEYATMTMKEQGDVLKFIADYNKRKLPLVLGVGGNSTSGVIHKIQHVDFTNVDAILSVVPYYNKPSQKGMLQHFKAISAVSPVPVILYNVPGRTGINMTAETTLQLAHENDNIIAVKEASGNLEQVMAIIKDRPSDFLVLSGDDALTFPITAAGGDGVISVVANAYPHSFSQMVKYTREGNLKEAHKIHYELLHFSQMIFEDGNPSGIKAALQIMDITQSAVRLPLTTVSRSLYGKIEKEIGSIPFKK
jgi:4-hydroxy-tetrahydrodipicolinate synthase